MVNETTDVSNKEQAVFCLCLPMDVYEFEVHEEFIGLHIIDSTDASHIFAVIKAVLTQLHRTMNKIRGQCYDRAAAMAGTRSGVAKLVLAEEARAIYTQCQTSSLAFCALLGILFKVTIKASNPLIILTSSCRSSCTWPVI